MNNLHTHTDRLQASFQTEALDKENKTNDYIQLITFRDQRPAYQLKILCVELFIGLWMFL